MNPFETLGLSQDADEHQVRARYLELVKQFPPEHNPDRFREIQSAFESARDPLTLAKAMLVPPDDENPPTWQDAIDAHAKRPPRMQVDFLLSLGNRSKSKTTAQSTTQSANDIRIDGPHELDAKRNGENNG